MCPKPFISNILNSNSNIWKHIDNCTTDDGDHYNKDLNI